MYIKIYCISIVFHAVFNIICDIEPLKGTSGSFLIQLVQKKLFKIRLNLFPKYPDIRLINEFLLDSWYKQDLDWHSSKK